MYFFCSFNCFLLLFLFVNCLIVFQETSLSIVQWNDDRHNECLCFACYIQDLSVFKGSEMKI